MSKVEVVGLGALNVDHIYRVERIVIDGETVVNEFGVAAGGSAANTIYGLGKLGIIGGFAGAVGEDKDGELLVMDFQTVGADISQIRLSPQPTGTVLSLSDKLGQRSLYVLPGANGELTINDIDMSYINEAKLLHLSSFVGDKQFKMCLEVAKQLSPRVKLSFSPGALFVNRGLKALTPILKKTHVLFINQNEIKELTGQDFASGAEALIKLGCRIVVVTLGQDTKWKNNVVTSYIRDSQQEYAIKPIKTLKVTTIDTTGTGDAFAAGFLFGLFNGKDLLTCGQLGDIVARFCVTRVGARPGLPTPPPLLQTYEQVYKKPL